MMRVEVELDGVSRIIRVDPVGFFADPDPDEIRLFTEAIGEERFQELQEGVVAMAAAGQATAEQLAAYSAPDILTAIINVKLRAYGYERAPDAPVGYRNSDGEVDDMREVALG